MFNVSTTELALIACPLMYVHGTISPITSWYMYTQVHHLGVSAIYVLVECRASGSH